MPDPREEIDSLWDFNDPASSEHRFREAAADCERRGDATVAAIIRTQIARAQGLQGRFDEAHRTLDDAAAAVSAIASGTTIADPVAITEAVIRILLERGRVFNSSGEREAARPLFDEAWRLAREAGLDALAVDAAHMMAIVAPDAAEAMAWNDRALELADSSPDPAARRWAASLHNNIGWTLHGQGDFSRALPHFERALQLRRERGREQETRIARWCVARCLRSLGRVEEALAMQHDLERDHAAHGSADGFVHEELAECLHALGRAAEARPHFARACELLASDSWFAKNEPSRLERLRNMAASEH
jgi:tetratricopeptide (TPR) repeat protein